MIKACTFIVICLWSNAHTQQYTEVIFHGEECFKTFQGQKASGKGAWNCLWLITATFSLLTMNAC